MLFLKWVLLCLLLVSVSAASFNLSSLLEKICSESDSAAVYFNGIDDNFVVSFMRSHPDVAVTIFTEIPTNFNKDFYQKNAILVTQSFDEVPQRTNGLETFIRQMRTREFVVIVARKQTNFYSWLSFYRRNHFKRIFGVVNDTSYAYLYFADQPLQQLSGTEDRLPDALKDFNGYPFRTSMQMDIPSCFWYVDRRGRKKIGGYGGQIFLQFLRRHNATVQQVLIGNPNERSNDEIASATLDGIIDISMNSAEPALPFLDYTRPIKFNSWCIIVGVYKYIPRHESMWKPFSPTVWVCIVFSLIFIVAMDFLKDACVGVPPSWWRSFRRTYSSFLSSAIVDAPTAGYRFHGQVHLFAFIVINFYLAFCTSFLTSYIKHIRMDTFQDLIDKNILLAVPNNYLFAFQEWGNHELDGIALPMKASDHKNALLSIRNTSLAYTVFDDFAEVLMGWRNPRQHLQLHVLRQRITSIYRSFLLPRHSIYKDILQRTTEDMVASGLVEKWERDVPQQTASARPNIEEGDLLPELPAVLEVADFRFAWICLLVGLSFATIVFLCELCSVRVLRKYRNRA